MAGLTGPNVLTGRFLIVMMILPIPGTVAATLLWEFTSRAAFVVANVAIVFVVVGGLVVLRAFADHLRGVRLIASFAALGFARSIVVVTVFTATGTPWEVRGLLLGGLISAAASATTMTFVGLALAQWPRRAQRYAELERSFVSLVSAVEEAHHLLIAEAAELSRLLTTRVQPLVAQLRVAVGMGGEGVMTANALRTLDKIENACTKALPVGTAPVVVPVKPADLTVSEILDNRTISERVTPTVVAAVGVGVIAPLAAIGYGATTGLVVALGTLVGLVPYIGIVRILPSTWPWQIVAAIQLLSLGALVSVSGAVLGMKWIAPSVVGPVDFIRVGVVAMTFWCVSTVFLYVTWHSSRQVEGLDQTNTELAIQDLAISRTRQRLEFQLSQLLHGRVQGRLSAALMACATDPGLTHAETRIQVDLLINRSWGDLLAALAPAGPAPSHGDRFTTRVAALKSEWLGVLEVVVDSASEVEQRLDTDGELGRAVMEALAEGCTNALRHGHATRIRARLDGHDGLLRLVMDDDGTAASRIGPDGGGARRLAISGGRRTITLQNAGCRVEIVWPAERRESLAGVTARAGA